MQPSDVKMYGRDYSAREFTPEEFDRYRRENPGERPVQWLDRYIGYPGNPKCISHYPGMYRRHWEAGRPVSLFHQIGYTDMEGGFARGRSHAQVAVADAQRVGWDGESHITACMDRFYAKAGLRTLTAHDLSEYMRGYRSVLGDRAGFYGFYDSMRDAVNGGWASFYIQCGARSAHINGIHAWQENNYQPRVFGTQTDILELYADPTYAFGGTIVTPDDRKAIIEGVVNYLIGPEGEKQELWSWVQHGNLAAKDAREISLGNKATLAELVEKISTGGTAIDYDKLAAALKEQGLVIPSARQYAEAVRDIMKEAGN